MKILLLGKPIQNFTPTAWLTQKVSIDDVRNYDMIVSYGYRHIIREPILSEMRGKIINLHISFLPYNKGADPNLWSVIDDTPCGVTIHHINKGLDTGNIIIQKRIFFSSSQTIRESYDILSTEIEKLFVDNYEKILQYESFPQPEGGRPHKSCEIHKPIDYNISRELFKNLSKHYQ